MSVNVTEPKLTGRRPLGAPNPLFLRDEELTRGIELLDAAYRALIAQPDRRLAGLGLGRNHQRVLYFVGRHPGITMVELLGLVQLTKQSVSRLLRDLVGRGLIVRSLDHNDRRQRPLELTEQGRALDEQITGRLRQRLAGAYRAAGAEAVAGYHKVLLGLVEEHGRRSRRGAK